MKLNKGVEEDEPSNRVMIAAEMEESEDGGQWWGHSWTQGTCTLIVSYD